LWDWPLRSPTDAGWRERCNLAAWLKPQAAKRRKRSPLRGKPQPDFRQFDGDDTAPGSNGELESDPAPGRTSGLAIDGAPDSDRASGIGSTPERDDPLGRDGRPGSVGIAIGAPISSEFSEEGIAIGAATPGEASSDGIAREAPMCGEAPSGGIAEEASVPGEVSSGGIATGGAPMPAEPSSDGAMTPVSCAKTHNGISARVSAPANETNVFNRKSSKTKMQATPRAKIQTTPLAYVVELSSKFPRSIRRGQDMLCRPLHIALLRG
jgi:hypothetical protein